MRPLQARCHLGLAEVCANTGKPDAACTQLAVADQLFATMAMTSWRRRGSALEARLGLEGLDIDRDEGRCGSVDDMVGLHQD